MMNVLDPRTTPARTCLAIVLTAGEGTRMRSDRPKVLHEIGGRSLLGHVLAALSEAGAERIAVVVGPDRPEVVREVGRFAPGAASFEQRERLGTAHAVLAARAAFESPPDDIVVAFGDTPLVRAETFGRLRQALAQGAGVVALGFTARDPHGYGRFLTDGDDLLAIREEKDASEAERRVTLCNAGLMALSGRHALAVLEGIGNANAQREYYLTDAVEVARSHGLRTAYVTAPEEEVLGINDRVQLAGAEAILQERLRRDAMLAGATLVAPGTVYLNADTRLGRDVIVEPFVVFGAGVTVEAGAVIRAHSHLEGARVGAGAIVGPYARLRPGTDLAENVHVGNFVEIKNASLGRGTKANHLAYIGDASVGSGTNIGAGTITCNYDGFAKHRTVIGDGAFIGTNSSLVAPVTIGDGAYIGSGSVITEAVPADALALGRGRQVVKEGWASAFRASAKPRPKAAE